MRIEIKSNVSFGTWTTQSHILSLQQNDLSGLQDQLISGQSQWRSCTLLYKDIYKQFTANVYVFLDSVLWLGGKCPQFPESAGVWGQDLISYAVSTLEYCTLDSLNGEPCVLKWKIFTGHDNAASPRDPGVHGEWASNWIAEFRGPHHLYVDV